MLVVEAFNLVERKSIQEKIYFSLSRIRHANESYRKKGENVEAMFFEQLSKAFDDLAVLFNDIGSFVLRDIFMGFSKINKISQGMTNIKAQKKVLELSHEYEYLLMHLQGSFFNKEKLNHVFRSFELLRFKQDRLKNVEFSAYFNKSFEEDGYGDTHNHLKKRIC